MINRISDHHRDGKVRFIFRTSFVWKRDSDSRGESGKSNSYVEEVKQFFSLSNGLEKASLFTEQFDRFRSVHTWIKCFEQGKQQLYVPNMYLRTPIESLPMKRPSRSNPRYNHCLFSQILVAGPYQISLNVRLDGNRLGDLLRFDPVRSVRRSFSLFT